MAPRIPEADLPRPSPIPIGTYRSPYLERQAVCHRMLKQYDKAVVAWTKMLEGLPDNPSLLTARALEFGAMGDREAALSDFNKAVEQNPNAPVFRRRRGMYYASLGEWQLAVEDYTAAASGDRSEVVKKSIAHTVCRSWSLAIVSDNAAGS